MRRTLLCLLTFFYLQGCAAVSVHHQGLVPAGPEGQRGTYAWLENSVPSGDSRVNNPEISEIVRTTVERQLLQRGYTAVPADQADYLLTWFGKINEEVKEISLNRFYATYGYGTLSGNMPKNVDGGKVRKVFPRGTLIIDVLDIDTKAVIWRGSATNTFSEGMNSGQLRKYISVSVAKILEDLPRQK